MVNDNKMASRDPTGSHSFLERGRQGGSPARLWPHGDNMISKLIGTATLFAAGTLMAGGPASLGAIHVEAFGAEAALSQAGDCGAKDAKEDAKAPAHAKDDKAKDASCGKGSCGSKDVKAKKGTKTAKDAKCGKDKKDASCGKDKKEASCGADKK